MHVLGIDVGGTKTVCLLANDERTILAEAREAARAGGWGYVVGDEGSGYFIGRHALRAVVRHADGRGRETSLTPRLLGHFGLTSAAELIRRVYHEELAPGAIGALAGYVQEAR